MNILQKLRLLAEWSPLLAYMQSLAAEDDVNARAVIVSDALEWVASRTETEWDDDFCKHVSDVLVSEEGEALVRWIVEQLKPDDSET